MKTGKGHLIDKTIITFKYAHRFVRFEGTKSILEHWNQFLKHTHIIKQPIPLERCCCMGSNVKR